MNDTKASLKAFQLKGSVLTITVLELLKADMSAISCGVPINFVVINKSELDPPYPWNVRCAFASVFPPTYYHWGYFIIDVGFFYALLLCAWSLVKKNNIATV